MTRTGLDGWFGMSLVAGDYQKNIVEPYVVTPILQKPVQKLSFNDAADYTAKAIAERYDNLHVCLSGGLDSEFICKVLLRNNIPFTPVVVNTMWSEMEMWYTYKFCNENNIKPMVLDYTDHIAYDRLILQIINVGLELQYTPRLAMLPVVITDLFPDAKVLTGFGEPFFNSNDFNEPLGTTFDLASRDMVLNLKYPTEHPGAFFTYTPEILRACVADVNTTVNTQMAKAELYNILPRPKMWTNLFDHCKNPAITKTLDRLEEKYYKPFESQSVVISQQDLLNWFN